MGNCESVISAMRKHPSDARVQGKGCKALANLADNSNNQVTIAAAGGIEAVISAMWAHPSDASIQEYGCSALMTLAINSNNQVTIAEADGIEAVTSAMRAHPSNLDVQLYGCWALRIWAVISNNQVTIAAAGGIEAVIYAMQAHPSDKWVQGHGCGALVNLASKNSNNQVTIASAGGIETVIYAMLEHPSDARVQRYGCLALMTLAINSNNKGTIADAGGIEAVISAMRTHPSDSSVQIYGCFAIWNLAGNSNNQVTIAALGCSLGAVAKFIDSRQKHLDRRRQKGQAIVGVVCSLIPIFGEICMEGLAEMVCVDAAAEIANQSLIGILKASQNSSEPVLSEPVLSEPDSSIFRPHKASLPVLILVCFFILIFGGGFAKSIGPAAEMVCVDTTDMDIVDCLDHTAHIQELIVDQIGEKVNDRVTALADQSMTDLSNRLLPLRDWNPQSIPKFE